MAKEEGCWGLEFFFFLLPWSMVEPDGATVEVVLLLYYDGLVFVVDVY